jgi:cupin 2 domain-containing protein
MSLKPNNIFEFLPANLDTEVFENIFQSGELKIERIISKGHSSPATQWYDQAQSEWVMILQGEAIVAVENDEDQHLLPGSYLNIPAHTRHRVKWTSPEVETIWLAIHY